MKNFKFSPQANEPRLGIAVIFDLEGFSRFFNQPDVQIYMSAFLNHIFENVEIAFTGGIWKWYDSFDQPEPLNATVVHSKFMGDGALYLLTPVGNQNRFSESDVIDLCNRLWNLKKAHGLILKLCADDVPVADLPLRIRFGMRVRYHLRAQARR